MFIRGGETTKMRPFRRLLSNKTAAGGVVFALVFMMVMILVGIIVVNSLISSVTPNTTWSLEANNTWTATKSNIWLAMGLVVIGIIIMGAFAILSMMRGGETESL